MNPAIVLRRSCKGDKLKAVIFLGPSLPLDNAREILDAIYLPPVQQGTLLTATVNHRPDVIGVIDGVFLQSLSVWHKEILYALDQGIKVYGASSMGALRAAETAPFGMIGVGEIYRQYASGELQDDDEVALAHTSAEDGYRKVSEPMVNIRATFAAAEAEGLIDASQRSSLNAIAKEMYFAQRTFPAILKAAADEGLSADLCKQLSSFVRTNYVDQKRRDSIELLETVKRLSIVAPESHEEKKEKSFEFIRSSFLGTLYNRDRHIVHEDLSLPLESISNYVALHEPDFDTLNFNALNRGVVFAFSEVLGIVASDAEIDGESARFRKKHNLDSEAALSAWLANNHFSAEEFRDLMTQLAHCRRLHRWLMFALWMDRTTQLILDELRLTGRYEEWTARAASQERLLQSELAKEDYNEATWTSLDDLLKEHQEWTDCRVDIDVTTWAEEAGFHTDGNLKMELARSRAARRVLMELLASPVAQGNGSRTQSTKPEGGGDET
jgi:hypothetical protein